MSGPDICQTVLLGASAVSGLGALWYVLRDHGKRIKSLEDKMPDNLAARMQILEQDLPGKLGAVMATNKNVETQMRKIDKRLVAGDETFRVLTGQIERLNGILEEHLRQTNRQRHAQEKSDGD
jgi:hypothetical protein